MAEPERTDAVLVIGGGLAGIRAALHLADAGRSVTLLESRPRLGGAASSFRRGPLTIDNGQHVFLRCCTAYRDLLERLGATGATQLQDHLDITVLSPTGPPARLARTPGVPAPLQLGAALARYRLLRPVDRVRIGRGALALRGLDPLDPSLDRRSLGDFLRAHGQNDATIDTMWSVIAVATLNAAPDDASLSLAAKVFQTGLLDHADGADIGYARIPLGAIHDGFAREALAAADVEVLCGHRVRQVGTNGSVAADSRSGVRNWQADAVVLALPHHVAFDVAPQLAQTSVAPAGGLGSSPIVNVHVVYDRRVTELDFAAAVGSPVQWVFDRTGAAGVDGVHPGAQYLAVTVSAADAIIDTPARDLTQRFVAELARLLPAASAAQVLDAFVTRERRATFAQHVGCAGLRYGSTGMFGAVTVAGAWTDTGWPDTMESAVRSGTAAAQAVLSTSSAQAWGSVA